MSTDAEDLELAAAGVPELTALGKRIELLRIERRMSKRILAQRAGTSRQQLWRVMTGKSELTSSLCARLSEVLEVDSRWLREAGAGASSAPDRREHASNGNASEAPSEFDRAAQHDPRHFVTGRVRFERDAAHLNGAAAAREPRRIPLLCETLEDYVASPSGLEGAIDGMPLNDDGRRLKRALLNAVEEAAESRRTKLPPSFFDLRRQVVNGER